MIILVSLLVVFSICAYLVKLGIDKERAEELERRNEYNEQILEDMRKAKDFSDRLRSDPDFARRVSEQLNNAEK